METRRPRQLETDAWKESLLENFLSDLELKSTQKVALPRIFMHTAAYFSSKTALMEKRDGRYVSISYREVAEQATAFAAALIEGHIERQDRIALLLKNSPTWVVSDLGTQMAAGVVVPIYENLIPATIQHILNDSGAKMIVVENKAQFQKIQEIWPEVPNLKLVILRNSEEVGRKKNVVTFESFLKKGNAHLRKEPNCVAERLKTLGRDDMASIVYTSGTTGNPKGVVLTHGNFVGNVMGVISVTDINSLDTLLSLLPLSHVFERTVGYYTPLLIGATIAYAESIERIPQNLVEVRPTICGAVPRVFEKIHARMVRNIESSGPLHRLIFNIALAAGNHSWDRYHRLWYKQQGNGSKQHRLDDRLRRRRIPLQGPLFSMINSVCDHLVYSKVKQKMGGRLRYFISGGAPLSPELIHFFRNLGVTIYEGYGMTESSPIISFNYRNAFEPGTVGKILPNVKVKISKKGEILIKGPNVMKGYFNNPEATNEVIDKQGWLHTGDIGTFAKGHFLKITDRIKEIVVMSNGKNVAPLPIESKLAQSPWTANAVAIGNGRKFMSALIFPNLDELKAFAQTEGISSKTFEDLCRHEKVQQVFSNFIKDVNGQLSRYEQIKKFELVPAILSVESGELTPTLKVKRRIIELKFKEYIDRQYRVAA